MKETNEVVRKVVREGTGIACALLLVLLPFGVPAFAQTPAPAQSPAAQPSPQLLTPDQLDDLVAPVALYPDALLSQVLVASTYPLEIVEASQWLQQNRNLTGQQLVDAARQQNWDPSIQALVVFPDVINRLSSNISWTSDLGNAFLAQQADVMNAVQRMRTQARNAGKLNSDSRQTVITQTDGGRTVIEIVPANPQVIYVPVYDPTYVWGPPVWGYYPAFYDPGISVGFGFGPGIFIGAYFGGWGGWGGWGWGPNWFNSTVVQNGFFFSHYGFRNHYGGGFGRGGVWAHNPYHRMGVPYSNRALANRFGGSYMGHGGVAHAGLGGQRSHAYSGARFQGAAGGWRRLADSGGGQRGLGGGSGVRGLPSGRGSAGGSGVRGLPSGRGSAGGSGQWSHFNGFHSASTGRGSGSGVRPSTGSLAGRSAPAFHQATNSGGFRSAPSFGGGRSFSGSRPSFSGGGSHSFGGSRSGGFSGGGFHGGGSFHGGGGGHGGGRR